MKKQLKNILTSLQELIKMKMSDLRPANEFAKQYGVKCITYGPAGSGKTPIINTCPNPVLLACEPGLLSMRGSKVPTWEAYTADKVDEFFEWFFKSNETKKFDTLAIDSISQMAEIYLDAALTGKSKAGNKVHGKAAYGQMATKTLAHLNALYFTQNKHTYLTAKQEILKGNIECKRPYFPGQQLSIEIAHKYDQVLHLDIQNIPEHGQHRAFRCIGTIDVIARDRTSLLSEFEPPYFGNIIKKCMS